MMKNIANTLFCACASLLLVACYEKVPEPVKVSAAEIKAKNNLPEKVAASFSVLAEEMKVASGGGCNFDLIAGQPRDLSVIDIRQSSELSLFTGWAVISLDDELVGRNVWLKLTGAKNYIIQAERVARQDVAEYFNKKEIVQSGFQVNASLSNVKIGNYIVSILIEGDNTIYECGVVKSINIL